MKKEKQIFFNDGEMVEFEILKLLDQYDPFLKIPTIPVDFNNLGGLNLASLCVSLMKSVEHYGGLGLSANQVGFVYRICVINHIQDNKVYSLINPRIIEQSDKTVSFNEGCLSFPGLFLKISRPDWVVVEFQAGNGEKLTKKFEGVYSTCVLHELDHLDGKVFTDLVSPIKLEIAKQKVKQNIRKFNKIKH